MANHRPAIAAPIVDISLDLQTGLTSSPRALSLSLARSHSLAGHSRVCGPAVELVSMPKLDSMLAMLKACRTRT